MTEARFTAFRRLLKLDDFALAILVEMGADRLQHGFWRFCDPAHRLFEPGNPFQHVLHDYYVKLDGELGKVVEAAGDDASVLVVSDHGAKAMQGGICINEWLQREGYLTLKEHPTERCRLTPKMVDWSKTRAWGEGGYYARLFLNVQGREPEGQVAPADYEQVRSDLAAGLRDLGDEEGKPIGTRVFRPEEIYREVRGLPPDLIVYFGDLDWRSVGSVGVGSCHVRENDTGPDDANHQADGVIVWDPGPSYRPRRQAHYSIYDVAPSILRFLDVEAPKDMVGQSII
jgi:predicted AlkP superfamily phosphohydrolase/phosphomutase